MARLKRIAFLRLLKERNQKAQGYSNLNLCFNKLKKWPPPQIMEGFTEEVEFQPSGDGESQARKEQSN